MGGRTTDGLIITGIMLLIIVSVIVVPMILVKPAGRNEQEGSPRER